MTGDDPEDPLRHRRPLMAGGRLSCSTKKGPASFDPARIRSSSLSPFASVTKIVPESPRKEEKSHRRVIHSLGEVNLALTVFLEMISTCSPARQNREDETSTKVLLFQTKNLTNNRKSQTWIDRGMRRKSKRAE